MLIMRNILEKIGIILRTHGKELNFISLKTVASSVSNVLSLDNTDTIANPYDIANTFNNCFTFIAETTKKQNIHINIFQIIFQMKVVVQYFCNLLIKKK